VIGTLAVDGWAVTFGTASRSLGGLQPRFVPLNTSLFAKQQQQPRSPPSPLLAVPNVTAHPSTVSVQLRIIRCGAIIAFGVLRVKVT